MITMYEKLLNDLLAVLHRDGGHYLEEYGFEKSIEDAIIKVLKHYHAIDELKRFFTSSNDIPVERATILTKDFLEILDGI